MNWIIDNWIEIFGAIAGIAYIYLSIKENILLWPVGLVTTIVYIYVFFVSKFYADMSLQVYYVFISIYGWYFWLKGKKDDKNDSLQISKLTKKLTFILLVITFVLFVVISQILVNFTDSPVPYWDAFTTAASIVATWMLAKKYLEQWLVWVVVDIVSLILYFWKGLYPTVVLFGVYTIMAVVGYYQWRKTLRSVK